jgi:hypothetical protein
VIFFPKPAHFAPFFEPVDPCKCVQFRKSRQRRSAFKLDPAILDIDPDGRDAGANGPPDHLASPGAHAGVKLQFLSGGGVPLSIGADGLAF